MLSVGTGIPTMESPTFLLRGLNLQARVTSTSTSILRWMWTMWERKWGCPSWNSGPASCPAFLSWNMNKEPASTELYLRHIALGHHISITKWGKEKLINWWPKQIMFSCFFFLMHCTTFNFKIYCYMDTHLDVQFFMFWLCMCLKMLKNIA